MGKSKVDSARVNQMQQIVGDDLDGVSVTLHDMKQLVTDLKMAVRSRKALRDKLGPASALAKVKLRNTLASTPDYGKALVALDDPWGDELADLREVLRRLKRVQGRIKRAVASMAKAEAKVSGR